MAESNRGEHKLRFPELVSFIGQTGAGKSTIVKLLIDQQERQFKPERMSFSSPVVGSIRSEHVPTSGNVHLYSDPRTYFDEYPMLYADCEGLEGGETLPMSVRAGNVSVLPKEVYETEPDSELRRRLKRSRVAHGTQHNIRWADSPEKSKRQYAVTELYPRQLYTLSDVIVFVLRNPK
jgi:energy-coupling factor transporter ATP-binding protein EcfA2